MISLLIKNLEMSLINLWHLSSTIMHTNTMYRYMLMRNWLRVLQQKGLFAYKQANPFVVLDAKYSPAPPSIVNKVRLKKINNEFSDKSKDELLQLLNIGN